MRSNQFGNWSDHVRYYLGHSLVVRYEDMVDDWQREANRLGAFLEKEQVGTMPPRHEVADGQVVHAEPQQRDEEIAAKVIQRHKNVMEKLGYA